MKFFRPALATLALALFSTAPLQGQQAAPPAQIPDSVREMVEELETLRQRIGEVQDSALEANPELAEARQEVQEWVEARVLEQNPGLETAMERLRALGQEAAEAQASQDTARVRELVQEGVRLRGELQRAQAETLEAEDVQARIGTFEDRMVTAMVAIDPDVGDALARMEELARRLQAFQRGG